LTKVDDLLDRGVALKRSGNLKGAKDCYLKALETDPYNIMVFISLGKTAHLLKEQELAVRCYLSATHLQLAPIEKSIVENRLPMHLKFQYDTFASKELSQLPKKSAFVIFLDSNTPKHIAHSVIDLSPQTLNDVPQLKPYVEIYSSDILGNGSYNQTLKKWGLTTVDQREKEEQVYIPFGRNFLIKQLQWEKLSRNDVLNIYLNY
jgi:tetratricopeptide (TPR) repeat protein